MKTAIIVCTRLKSRRLPGKCAININGLTVLNHLHNRLSNTGIPIIYAIPSSEAEEYKKIFSEGTFKPNSYYLYVGEDEDPMRRMYDAAKEYKIENIIRQTHDKIFIDEFDVYKMLDKYYSLNLDYIYSSSFTAGTSMEVIHIRALEKAVEKFKNVEHISYAIKAITNNSLDLDFSIKYDPRVRLLIDYEEDLTLMNTIFANLGNECTQAQVLSFLNNNSWAAKINKMPTVTIYTCAYNAEKWISQCMQSVVSQIDFNNFEYILIDDHSTDKTSYFMSKFAAENSNVKYIRNPKNLGLSSSSNVALKEAKGKYIVRLDADDYFTRDSSVVELKDECVHRGLDAVYPNNYFGNYSDIQTGKDCHHVGGTMFKTSAINHLKFTDNLRNYEGLDLWVRAKDVLKIGYLNRPIFFYRQHMGSMSKNNIQLREATRQKILSNQIGLVE